MKVFIQSNTDYCYPIKYVLKLIELQAEKPFAFVQDESDADLIWNHQAESSQPICSGFYKNLKSDGSKLRYDLVFMDSPKIKTSEGKKDTIGTIFYMGIHSNFLRTLCNTSQKSEQLTGGILIR